MNEGNEQNRCWERQKLTSTRVCEISTNLIGNGVASNSFRRLRGSNGQSQFLADRAADEPANAVRLPARYRHDLRQRGSAFPLKQSQHTVGLVDLGRAIGLCRGFCGHGWRLLDVSCSLGSSSTGATSGVPCAISGDKGSATLSTAIC
jgi:hypothetical protein